jgi:hypothetical protein
MSTERKVTFRIRATRGEGKYVIDVWPYLNNIRRADDGEQILLAIAANCVRALAKRDGLERALERCADAVINHTTFIR